MPDHRSGVPDVGPVWVLLLVLLAVPAALTLAAAAPRSHEAPPFALRSTGYEDGVLGEPVAFQLADYRGRVLVLDLMAVTCEPCRDVTRDVMRPLRAEADPAVALLSVDTWADPATGIGGLGFGGETDASLRALQASDEAPWRHALDTDEVWRKYAAVTLPRVVVIDPYGRIAFDEQGVPSLADVRAAIAAAKQADASGARPEADGILRLGVPAIAALAGAAALMSPCTVGLLPAYLGLLLRARGSVASAAVGGLVVAAGIVAVYAALAAAFALAGDALRPLLGAAPLAIGALFILAGAWAALGGTMRVGAGRLDGRKGLFTFGLAFGLAGFGCTGPLFLPILVAGFARSTAQGAAAFALYAGTVAAGAVAAAVLVAAGRGGALRALARHGAIVGRLAGVVLIGAGAWLVAGALDLGG